MTGNIPEESPLDRDPDRLFEAVAALLARCPSRDDGVLRPLVRALVTEAKLLGLYPEMLLRVLKESWRAIPEPVSATARLAHLAALEHLVTLCISEFYRTDGRR